MLRAIGSDPIREMTAQKRDLQLSRYNWSWCSGSPGDPTF